MTLAVLLHGLVFLSLFTPSWVAAASSSKVPPAISICPSRTVNYITHGLPQQCLTSSRSPSFNTTVTLDQTGTSVLVATETSSDDASISIPVQAPASEEALGPEFEWAGPAQWSPSTTALQTSASSAPEATSLSTHAINAGEPDADSPLGNANFLSFEDWRKQNLLKAGQSEHLGDERLTEQREPRKRPASIHNALDSIGDDAEIDLDFTGFVPTGPDLGGPKQLPKTGQNRPVRDDHNEVSPTARTRGKDAGTTSKERFNYASFDCAANVLKTNKEAKSASAVLGENKDSYMLNECSADNKYLILELCNDIQIDTIVLANFEFFSSTFRTIRVSVSDKYPVKIEKWKTLGSFEARNSREVQAFLVENPVIWTRFVRLEFLTHYGSEFYCPVSLVRIHGRTMLEEYKHDVDAGQGDDDDEDILSAEDLQEQEILVPEVIAEVVIEEEKPDVTSKGPAGDVQAPVADVPPQSPVQNETAKRVELELQPDRVGFCGFVSNATARSRALLLYPSLPGSHAAQETSVGEPTCSLSRPVPSEERQQVAPLNISPTLGMTQNGSKFLHTENQTTTTDASANSTSVQVKSSETSLKLSASPTTTNGSSTASAINNASSEKLKTSPSSTQAPPPVPTIQESFFKSVQKRLQMLETGSSLSLQYIEEQSRALRDAFNKVEQRQLAKTSTFLDYLNSTVLNELRDFRQQYDQLWQSTVIELEMQREQFQHETIAINARLGVLADEVIFQKRMAILQMVLILICLGLILFSRGSIQNYLELPIVQNMLSRSPSSKWMHLPGLETPSQSPAISRPSSSHQMKPDRGILKGHHREMSEDSILATTSSTEIYSPLTPTSYEEISDNERREQNNCLEDPAFDPATLERPSTSPPVLPGGDGPMTPESLPVLGERLSTIESRLLDPSALETTAHEQPRVIVEDATSQSKHLTWRLPDT